MAVSEQDDPLISPDQPTRLLGTYKRYWPCNGAAPLVPFLKVDLQGMIQLPQDWSQRWSKCLRAPIMIPIILDDAMTASSTCGSMIQYPHTIA